MYDSTGFELSGRWPSPSLTAGRNVLVRHSRDADPTRLATSLAADECSRDEGCVVISTADDPATVIERLDSDGERPSPIGVVAQPGDTPSETSAVVQTAALSDGFRPFGETSQNVIEGVERQSDAERVRVAFSSVTDLLELTSASNVYRFLHIFTQQIQSTAALGVYMLGPDADRNDVRILRSLFDHRYRVEVDPSGWTRLSEAGDET